MGYFKRNYKNPKKNNNHVVNVVTKEVNDDLLHAVYSLINIVFWIQKLHFIHFTQEVMQTNVSSNFGRCIWMTEKRWMS